MTNSVFLIGGGWDAGTFSMTYGRFLQRAERDGAKRIAIIVAEEDGVDPQARFSRFFGAFAAAGLRPDEAIPIAVSAERPLLRARLSDIDPTGIFVAGGLTPAYHAALCLDRSWIELVTENDVSFAGFSAGAAIAAETAIIGGWRRRVDSGIVDVTNENAGEDLDLLDVRPGLGLVPFTVDVHATQWGNLARLVHTVDADLAENGWAIDENTMLETAAGQTTVHGTGSTYFVEKINGKVTVRIITRENTK